MGISSRVSPGSSRWASRPQLMAYPCLRLRSVSRSGVHATSRLPTLRAQGSPSSSRRVKRSTVRLGEGGHRLRWVDLEDEPRRVGGGPAGLEQRPLVDDGHVPPPEPGQVIRHAAPGDAGSDDDGPGVAWEGGGLVRHVRAAAPRWCLVVPEQWAADPLQVNQLPGCPFRGLLPLLRCIWQLTPKAQPCGDVRNLHHRSSRAVLQPGPDG